MPRHAPGHYDTDMRLHGPDELREDMTARDLVYVLQNLDFTKGVGLVTIDRSVRDYLIRALQQR